jgi:hypothetical protein
LAFLSAHLYTLTVFPYFDYQFVYSALSSMSELPITASVWFVACINVPIFQLNTDFIKNHLSLV